MAVIVAYLIYLPISALCFASFRLRHALLTVLIGGWWLLPVGRYDPVAAGTLLPWWITGIALPSDMLLTKAWVPPLVAFIGAGWRDARTLRDWRPGAIDALMVAWCIWPLVDGLGRSSHPAGAIAALYVTGSWGLPWLIGRVWLSKSEAKVEFTSAIAISGLANLPVAIIEGSQRAMLYGLLYGPHPYRFDGVARYFGYRPIGFLEHGNLYGLWSAIAAFAAICLLRDPQRGKGWSWTSLAAINVAIALMSQSVGALILLVLGLFILVRWQSRLFAPVVALFAAFLLVLGIVHLTGVLPMRRLAESPLGVQMLGKMRSIGRGSFLWRVSQDVKSLSAIRARPIAGTVTWDWWRQNNSRPWGQPLLLIGQYGLVGFLLAWGALISAAAAAFVRLRRGAEQLASDAGLPLAIIVLLALLDATQNAFFFSPAIVAAGAIAANPFRGRPAADRTLVPRTRQERWGNARTGGTRVSPDSSDCLLNRLSCADRSGPHQHSR